MSNKILQSKNIWNLKIGTDIKFQQGEADNVVKSPSPGKSPLKSPSIISEEDDDEELDKDKEYFERIKRIATIKASEDTHLIALPR